MEDREMIKGVYCEICKKFEDKECPVKSASPWSKFDYCNHWRNEAGQSIPEYIMEELKNE